MICASNTMFELIYARNFIRQFMGGVVWSLGLAL
jgi:hypothetical protein